MADSDPSKDAKIDSLQDEFLTTKQVATLLHVKERKIYDLAAAGEIPGTRALGKWLFDRKAIDAWLRGHNVDAETRRREAPPNVVLGSFDPLLEWALRESHSGLATFLDGSLDGLDRFARAEGLVSGLHIHDPETDDWNAPAVKERLPSEPAVLVEWAWRDRGLITAPGNPLRITGFADLSGKRVVSRQDSAGSQILLQRYLAMLTDREPVVPVGPARTEIDAALAVLESEADAAFGLRCVAKQFRLDFAPVLCERFDLLVWRRDWFQPPFQRLHDFTRTEAFRERAASFTGYDVSGIWTVHFNGR